MQDQYSRTQMLLGAEAMTKLCLLYTSDAADE